MNVALAYFRDLYRGTVGGWNRFWFTPGDPATLGIIRIGTGLMLLYTHAIWAVDLEAFFGAHSWVSSEVSAMGRSAWFWSYLFYVKSPGLLWTLHVIALGVFAMFTLGLASRVTSVLSFLIAVAYINRTSIAQFGLDDINVLLTLYLIIGASGGAYSFDRLIAGWRRGGPKPVVPSVTANISTRLIQLHMCLIYVMAGLSKLQGMTWWDGTAMWYAIANGEYQSYDLTWLANSDLGEIVINVLTHVTILWEVSYCFLVWPRMTRPIIVALAVPLHLGIGLFLGMMTFGTIMLVGNLAFVSPSLVRMVVDRRRPGQGRAGEADLNQATLSAKPHAARGSSASAPSPKKR